jgi:hypothetical protein
LATAQSLLLTVWNVKPLALKLFDLPRNRRVGNRSVIRQQKRLAQNGRKHVVAFEGQKNIIRFCRTARGHDAKILIVRLHQDVAAAEMDFVSAQVAAHYQKAVMQMAAVSDLQSWNHALQHLLARSRRRSHLRLLHRAMIVPLVRELGMTETVEDSDLQILD